MLPSENQSTALDAYVASSASMRRLGKALYANTVTAKLREERHKESLTHIKAIRAELDRMEQSLKG